MRFCYSKIPKFWGTMYVIYKDTFITTQICASRMNTGHKTKVPLQPMPVPTEPMAMTAMDVVGQLQVVINTF